MANNILVKDANGVVRTVKSTEVAGVHVAHHVIDGITTVAGEVSIAGTVPVTGSVTVTNQPSTLTISNFPAFPTTQQVSLVAGSSINIDTMPSVTLANPVTSLSINNLPSVQNVSVNNWPASQNVVITSMPQVAGHVTVSDGDGALTVDGAVSIVSLPDIAGAVEITNASLTVAGTVNVGNALTLNNSTNMIGRVELRVNGAEVEAGNALPVYVVNPGGGGGGGEVTIAAGQSVGITGNVTVQGTVGVAGEVDLGVDVVESAGLNALAVAITEGQVSLANDSTRELGKVTVTNTVPVTLSNTGPLPIQIANEAMDTVLGDSVPLNVAGSVSVTNTVKIAGNDGTTVASSGNPLFVAVDPSQILTNTIFIPDTTGVVGSSGQGMPVTTDGMATGLRTVTDGATIWRDYNFASELVIGTPDTSGEYENTTSLPLFNVWVEHDRWLKATVEFSKDGGTTWAVQEQFDLFPSSLTPPKIISHKAVAAISGKYRLKLENVGGSSTTRFAVWVGFSEGQLEKPIEVLGVNGNKLSDGGAINIVGYDNSGPVSASNGLPVMLHDVSGNILGMQGSVPLAINLVSNDGATLLGQPGTTPLEVNVMNASPIEVAIVSGGTGGGEITIADGQAVDVRGNGGYTLASGGTITVAGLDAAAPAAALNPFAVLLHDESGNPLGGSAGTALKVDVEALRVGGVAVSTAAPMPVTIISGGSGGGGSFDGQLTQGGADVSDSNRLPVSVTGEVLLGGSVTIDTAMTNLTGLEVKLKHFNGQQVDQNNGAYVQPSQNAVFRVAPAPGSEGYFNVALLNPVEIQGTPTVNANVAPEYTNLSIGRATINGGATPVTLASASAKAVDILNHTSTDLEYRLGGAGDYMFLAAKSSDLIGPITNANQISIRRVDGSATAITVSYKVLS